VDDAQAILLSDIFPTAWFGARLAEVGKGDTVVVLGAGPVGQAAVSSARLQRAGRVIVVDGVPDRLELARRQHAEVVDFQAEDPVQAVLELTGGIGADRVIDAVGIEAEQPTSGPGAEALADQVEQFLHERDRIAPEQHADDSGTWAPGNAPSLALRWGVDMAAKAASIGIIGVYPPHADHFPIGAAMQKNLTLKMGNCNHRRYVPELVSMTASGRLDPTPLISHWSGTQDAVSAYRSFDRREQGWTKVALGVSSEGAVPRGEGASAGSGAATTAG
jgi:threonine dehydrogenase-like Zn-dependent dehydrogenase